MGPGLLMSAAGRWIPEAKRNVATGIVNAGGSFGQFTVIPLAQLFIGLAGWQPAMVILGAIGLATIPLILWITRGQGRCGRARGGAACRRGRIAEAGAGRSP